MISRKEKRHESTRKDHENIKERNAVTKKRFRVGLGIAGATIVLGGGFAAVVAYDVAMTPDIAQPVLEANTRLLTEFDRMPMKTPITDDNKAEANKLKTESQDSADKVDPSKDAIGPIGKLESPIFNDGAAAMIEGDKDFAKNNVLLDSQAVVHYTTTSMPGETGNFAVSGHRTVDGFGGYKGGIFKNIDALKLDDKMTVTTHSGSFEYKVIKEATEDRRQTDAAGKPVNSGLLDTDPLDGKNSKGDDVNTTRKFMTITSCSKWTTAITEYVVLEMVDAK